MNRYNSLHVQIPDYHYLYFLSDYHFLIYTFRDFVCNWLPCPQMSALSLMTPLSPQPMQIRSKLSENDRLIKAEPDDKHWSVSWVGERVNVGRLRSKCVMIHRSGTTRFVQHLINGSVDSDGISSLLLQPLSRSAFLLPNSHHQPTLVLSLDLLCANQCVEWSSVLLSRCSCVSLLRPPPAGSGRPVGVDLDAFPLLNVSYCQVVIAVFRSRWLCSTDAGIFLVSLHPG